MISDTFISIYYIFREILVMVPLSLRPRGFGPRFLDDTLTYWIIILCMHTLVVVFVYLILSHDFYKRHVAHIIITARHNTLEFIIAATRVHSVFSVLFLGSICVKHYTTLM